jgi:predicted nucleic acid-binding protein
MIHFLDSSVLAKRYVAEAGSAAVLALFRGRKELAASRLAAVEVASALARRAREGEIAPAVARRHAAQLDLDLAEMQVIEPRLQVLALAAELVWRHALRAYDAIQLASATRLANATGLAVTFWCADRTLTATAKAEGLRAHVV